MCFYDDGDPAEVWNESAPTARKEHRCCECGGTILAGETYQRISFICDGEAGTFKVCDRCSAVRNRIAEIEESRGCEGPEAVCPIGQLRDAIYEDDDHYGLLRADPEKVVPHWIDPEMGLENLAVVPMAAHLFPDLAVITVASP